MYLKNYKSRKRDTQIKYNIKLKNNTRKGGAATTNDVMSDEAIHLYIGGIKMDAPAIFTEAPTGADERPTGPGRTRPLGRKRPPGRTRPGTRAPSPPPEPNSVTLATSVAVNAVAPVVSNSGASMAVNGLPPGPNALNDSTARASVSNNEPGPNVVNDRASVSVNEPGPNVLNAKASVSVNAVEPVASSTSGPVVTTSGTSVNTTPPNPVKLLTKKSIPSPEFNFVDFMSLLNTLCKNSEKLSQNALTHARKLERAKKGFYSNLYDYMIKFALHSKNYFKTTDTINGDILSSINIINTLKITDSTFNTFNDIIFKKGFESSWINLLKNILVDLLASISESIYAFNITEEDYRLIENSKLRKGNNYNSTIDEITPITTEVTKIDLSEIKLPDPKRKYSISDILGDTGKPLKYGTALSTILPKDSSLDYAIIRLLFDIIFQCDKNELNKMQIVKSLLLELQYLMNKMNIMVETELAKPHNNIPIGVINTSPKNITSKKSSINSPIPSKDQEVTQFLTKIGLAKFAPILTKEGFNDIDSIIDERLLDDEQLENLFKMSISEVRKFRDAVNAYKAGISKPAIKEAIKPNNTGNENKSGKGNKPPSGNENKSGNGPPYGNENNSGKGNKPPSGNGPPSGNENKSGKVNNSGKGNKPVNGPPSGNENKRPTKPPTTPVNKTINKNLNKTIANKTSKLTCEIKNGVSCCTLE
jgi:hypothetical protein